MAGALVLAQVAALSTPVVTGKLIDVLAKGCYDAAVLVSLLLALLGLNIFAGFFRYCFDRVQAAGLLVFEKCLRLRLWDAFDSMSIGEFETTPEGVLHSKMNRDISMLSMVIPALTEGIITSLIVGVGAFAMTLYWQPYLLLVALVALVINATVYLFFKNRLSAVTHTAHDSNEGFYRLAYDLIEMIPLFRVFSVMGRYRKYFVSNISDNIAANTNLNRVNIQFGTTIAAVAELGRYTVLVAAVALCAAHRITLGDVALYQSLFSQALDGLCRIVFLLPRIEVGREALCSIQPMLAIGGTAHPLSGAPASGAISGAITLDDVHFTYPGKDREALTGVSCAILRNEHVVILGKNGSGKSTLARLLLGYYKPDSGDILLDGVPGNLIDTGNIGAQMGFVPQAARVYRDSLLENIRLRDTSVSAETAIDAAHKCNLSRLLSHFPSGVHEQLSPDSLSGGETQCIAIARALVRHPKVLLLDEITSHLDIYSKRKVFDVLRSLHGSCTIVTITHDVEFVALADRVLIMDEGKLYPADFDTPPENITDILDLVHQPPPTPATANES